MLVVNFFSVNPPSFICDGNCSPGFKADIDMTEPFYFDRSFSLANDAIGEAKIVIRIGMAVLEEAAGASYAVVYIGFYLQMMIGESSIWIEKIVPPGKGAKTEAQGCLEFQKVKPGFRLFGDVLRKTRAEGDRLAEDETVEDGRPIEPKSEYVLYAINIMVRLHLVVDI